MEGKERVITYIDGSNLYFKLKKLLIPHTSQFNYRGLINYLTQKQTLISAHYYVGLVQSNRNNPKIQKIHLGQLNLFNTLRDQNIIVHKGYLMKSGGVYHEKGVDVNIAVDLLTGAYENLYDTALLLSSDTDLIPAIHTVQRLKKKVGYIGFAHNPSIAMRRHATYHKLLTKEEITPFIKKPPEGGFRETLFSK